MNDDIGVGLAKLLDEGIIALCHQTEEVAGVVLRNDYLCLGFRGDGGMISEMAMLASMARR